MARIAGVNLPVQKHVWVGLQSIYGIGRTRSKLVCETAGVTPATKIRDLTEAQVEKLRVEIGNRRAQDQQHDRPGAARAPHGQAARDRRDRGGAARRRQRHRRGLPLRGQRTRTNARTRKGPRKAIKK